MLPRGAARTPGRARRRALRGAAFQALLLVVLAGAWPSAVAATGATPPASSATSVAQQEQLAVRALCPPAAPGYMSCLALVRTDSAPLTRSAVGPLTMPRGFAPSQLLSAYGLPDAASGAGSGITVAIVDAFDLPTAASDLATYRSQFGLSPCTTQNGCFRKIDQHGSTIYPAYDQGWGGEIALDIEMVSAICPNCHILLVESDSTSVQDLGTAENTAVGLGAVVVSNSYAGPEFLGENLADSAYYNHPGVAITVGAGDDGYGVDFPASSPHVTSVGGTSLATAANARGWTETAWDMAGSGCSAYEPKPAWQHDPSCANRTVADVSAVADLATGVAVYSTPSGGWVRFGGTSVATPIIAGVYALAGAPSPGTYPASYPYAQSGQLNDVTSGSNGSCGGTYLCTAMGAYDGPTGLGTPNGTGAFTAPGAPSTPTPPSAPAAPSAPTAVIATAGNKTALVSWHAPAGNGNPITGYTVTSTPESKTCTTAGTVSCTVSGLTNGASYTFSVTATNSTGTGPASTSSASVIPATAPDAPTGVTAAPADGSAIVSWSAPVSNGGRTITGYTVSSSPPGSTCTTTGSLSCTVLGLANGTSYAFTVTATNPMGTGPASAPSSSVTPIMVSGASGATYVVVTPNRLVDSRIGLGLASGLTANVAQTFPVTGQSADSTRNIPASAIAVTGNLTVTGQTAPGYFALTPVATNSPTTSTLNFPHGDIRANGVTVPLGAGGMLSITYAAPARATAQVVFDVTGYFLP